MPTNPTPSLNALVEEQKKEILEEFKKLCNHNGITGTTVISLSVYIAHELTQAMSAAYELGKGESRPLASIVRQMYRQMEGSDETLLFDIVAMAFEGDTGIWPPGKSAPLEMYHKLTQEERSKKFSDWVKNIHQLARIQYSAPEDQLT